MPDVTREDLKVLIDEPTLAARIAEMGAEISRDYADAAVQTIYAGSNEIMKVIIAKRMGLG